MKNRIVLSLIGRVRKYWVKRTYKDRLFRVVFRDKKDLLSLYNAINETCYTNLDDLEIRILEDAVYLGYKNDLSFLISNTLNLYEHQSSTNPNMPLRGLIYFADMEAVRRYLELEYDLESAIDHAIDECVEKDKIADILIKNRAEVKDMLLTDFDEKKYRKMLIRDSKAEGYAEGKKEAIEALNELNRCLFEDGRLEDLNQSWNDRSYQEQLMKEYGLNVPYKEDKSS